MRGLVLLMAAPLLGAGLAAEEAQMSHHLSHQMGSSDPSDGDTPSSTEPLVPVPHKQKNHHGMPILQMPLEPEERLFWESYSTETYFNTPSSKRWALFTHMASYLFSFVFLYPMVLVFWNTNHSLYLPSLTVHAALVLVSCASLWIFNGSIRDLYPNNAFTKMSMVLFLATICHWVIALSAVAYRFLDLDPPHFDYDQLENDLTPVISSDHTLRGLSSSSRTHSFDLNSYGEEALKTSNNAMFPTKSAKVPDFFLKFPAFKRVTQAYGKTALALTSVCNWGLFAFFLVYFPTGIATYLVYGNDRFFFNMLAHFIKGGVFFVLGLVYLARYSGAFKNKGWAWNHKFVPGNAASNFWIRWLSSGLCSMELVESALILFYGATNVFMEHLSNPGGEFSAKDLQHVSIAFIFIGCGLCGVLLEKNLSDWRFHKATDNLSLVGSQDQVSRIVKATPGYSPNPFPVLTIYWTGYLMSLHEQASKLSSTLHQQWGNLFVLACAFRIITYIYMTIAPANPKYLTKPLYPMTELLVSFGLICGGMIFIESCDPVVYLLEYHGYTPMFTFNISLGLVALIMAWVIGVFSMKDGIIARRSRTYH